MISNRNVEILEIVLDLQAGHYSLKHHLLSGQVQKYPLADCRKCGLQTLPFYKLLITSS